MLNSVGICNTQIDENLMKVEKFYNYVHCFPYKNNPS